MQNNELVSVIIPLYNCENLISRCLESLIAQTYRKIEIIIIDDGSTDKSGSIAAEYSREDSRIHLFHKNNGGVSSARNIGLKNAKGDYIVFVDSDDYVDENYIENLMSSNSDWVIAGYKNYKEKTLLNTIKFENKDFSVKQINANFYDFWKKYAKILVYSNRYKRDLLNDLLFDESMSLGEDLKFNLEYMQRCDTITYVPYSDYYRCDYDGSLVHRLWLNRAEKEEQECRLIESIGGENKELRWYHWHIALQHYEMWLSRSHSAFDKSVLVRALVDTYKNEYFRSSLPYIRKYGTKDQKIETFFMNIHSHKVFNLILRGLLGFEQLKRNGLVK